MILESKWTTIILSHDRDIACELLSDFVLNREISRAVNYLL